VPKYRGKGALVSTESNLRVPYNSGISCLAEGILAPQEENLLHGVSSDITENTAFSLQTTMLNVV